MIHLFYLTKGLVFWWMVFCSFTERENLLNGSWIQWQLGQYLSWEQKKILFNVSWLQSSATYIRESKKLHKIGQDQKTMLLSCHVHSIVCLNVKELLAQSRRHIRSLSDSSEIWIRFESRCCHLRPENFDICFA